MNMQNLAVVAQGCRKAGFRLTLFSKADEAQRKEKGWVLQNPPLLSQPSLSWNRTG